jgi:23S rRNA (pseudouridine1915-N3)-methyltransferase
MLKIRVVAIGKDKDRWVTDGVAHYTKLLARYCQLTSLAVPSPKQSKSLSPDETRRLEAERLRPHLKQGTTIALTDRGKQFDSPAFAKLLSRLQTTSGGSVTILIGGPYGLDTSILENADYRLYLSPLTFSHQLVRLVLLEQLYRGFSILNNTDYHK